MSSCGVWALRTDSRGGMTMSFRQPAQPQPAHPSPRTGANRGGGSDGVGDSEGHMRQGNDTENVPDQSGEQTAQVRPEMRARRASVGEETFERCGAKPLHPPVGDLPLSGNRSRLIGLRAKRKAHSPTRRLRSAAAPERVRWARPR